MKVIKILGFILLIFAGVFMIVYGEGDDSPGAQMLGLIGVVIGIWRIYKLRNNKK